MKFSFVILNYNSYQYTKDCISSIKEKCSNDYKIIIVDNNSSDNSGLKLKEEYKKDNSVITILNNENYGFSIGNNIGIKYALNNFKSDFIIVNNSDTLLLTDDFLNKINLIYKETKFAILGPKINVYDEKIQYIPYKLQTKKQISKVIFKYRILYLFTILGFTNIVNKYLNTKVRYDKNDIRGNKSICDVVLHGSFLIFSSEYFKYYSGFPELTKFYCEEELLYINCIKNKLITLYDPSIEVFHCSGASTKNGFKTSRKRLLFRFKNHIKSNKVLYKELKKL